MSDHRKFELNSSSPSDSLSGLGEFQLIELLTRKLTRGGERVVVGIGDDAAVLEPSDMNLLVTCDAQVDGVHFLSDAFTPEQVGERAAGVNLSDVAAMGGVARWAVVSLLLPEDASADWLAGVYRGLTAHFARHGCAVTGGNVSKTTGPLTIDITVIGEVERDRPLLRSGAQIGDLLCVTGSLGEAAAGLAVVLNPEAGASLPRHCTETLLKRYRTPTPRLEAGRSLRADSAVSSCMDVSDGLAGDAGHLAKASGVRIRIDMDRLPVSESLRLAARQFERDPLKWALSGGDDFELLFTVEPTALERLQGELARGASLPITVVGCVLHGPAGVEFADRGTLLSDVEGGFDHFGGTRDLK